MASVLVRMQVRVRMRFARGMNVPMGVNKIGLLEQRRLAQDFRRGSRRHHAARLKDEAFDRRCPPRCRGRGCVVTTVFGPPRKPIRKSIIWLALLGSSAAVGSSSSSTSGSSTSTEASVTRFFSPVDK